MHESGGDLLATVRGRGPRGGLDVDVHIPGCSEPLALTRVAFHGESAEGCPRGACHGGGA